MCRQRTGQPARNPVVCMFMGVSSTQDDAITKSTIFVDTKQHPSNNKCSDETLTVDTCTIQKVDIKPQDSETSKCCTKQSDIGTYFGLQPLMKSLDQSTQSKQGKMQLKSTFNEGGIGDAHNNDVTMDNAAIGGRYGAKKCPFYKKIPGNYHNIFILLNLIFNVTIAHVRFSYYFICIFLLC